MFHCTLSSRLFSTCCEAQHVELQHNYDFFPVYKHESWIPGGGGGGVDSHIKSDRDTRRKIKIKLLRETNVGVVLQGGKT